MSPERISYEKALDRELLAQHVSRYEFARQYVHSRVVADIACGTGYGAKILAQGVPERIVGLDISEEAVSHAREHYGGRTIQFHAGDAAMLSSLGMFDLIVSFETIEHVKDFKQFLKELTSSLTPQGILIISTPIRERGSLHDAPKNPFHLREWNASEFETLLSQYFRRREIYFQYVYAKRWYPGSRTVSRLLAKVLYPAAWGEFERYQVKQADVDMAGIPRRAGYTVAVCRESLGKGAL